eukprot:g58103.t1
MKQIPGGFMVGIAHGYEVSLPAKCRSKSSTPIALPREISFRTQQFLLGSVSSAVNSVETSFSLVIRPRFIQLNINGIYVTTGRQFQQ